jgi:2'-5' RNA ligase
MENQTGAVATQRLFFALWPEAALQLQLARVAAALLPEHAGRRVRTENLHGTLVFLGAVSAEQRVCVEAAADAVRTESFTVNLDRFGYFRRPQVAWLGTLDTPPSLLALVTQLSRGCAACGFPPEPRPYALHVTVARKLRRDPGRPPFMAVAWPVERFALVESVNAEDGTHYRPLRFWTLKKNKGLE